MYFDSKECANPRCAARKDQQGAQGWTNSTQARYCSNACRQAAYRDRRGSTPKRPDRRNAPCPVCGSDVQRAGKGRPRVYCSRSCRDRAQVNRTTRRDVTIDSLPEFLRWALPKAGGTMPGNELYEYHLRWCRNRPFPALSRRELYDQMRQLGFHSRRINRGVVFVLREAA